MKIRTHRDNGFIDIDRLTIRVDDVDFRLSLNNFGELVLNKYQNGDGEGSIIIVPKVSNEIIIK